MKKIAIGLLCLFIVLLTSDSDVLLGLSGKTDILPETVLEMQTMQELPRGITGTGLCYWETKSCFLIGNIGKETPADNSGFHSSIVMVGATFEEIQGEPCDLAKIYPAMQTIQGITLDGEDIIWYCSQEEGLVRSLSWKDGREPWPPIKIPMVSGIAWDETDDTLWAVSLEGGGMLYNIKKDGTTLLKYRMNLPVGNPDHIFVDGENQILYVTADVSYNESNLIFAVDLNSFAVIKKYTVEGSYAIEGLWIDTANNMLYVLNDGHYHDAKIPKNTVNIYRFE